MSLEEAVAFDVFASGLNGETDLENASWTEGSELRSRASICLDNILLQEACSIVKSSFLLLMTDLIQLNI